MLIFPMFSTLVWTLAMHWRRRWPSFVIVSAAMVFLLILVGLLASWREHLPQMHRIFYELLWPYIGLTGSIGYYICFLPRPITGVLNCRGCGYHLAGLNPRGLRCPECNAEWCGEGSGQETHEALIPIPTKPIVRRSDAWLHPPGDQEIVVINLGPAATPRRSAG